MPLLWAINLNYLLRRPWQSGLAGLGISLGVAVIVAVQIAQQSARNAFEMAQSTLFGRATHRIQADRGPLPESLFRDLCLAFPELQATPFLEASIRSTTQPHHWIQLIGIDAFSAFSAERTARAAKPALFGLVMAPLSGLTNANTLRHLNIANGKATSFDIDAQRFSLTLHAPAQAKGLLEALPDDVIFSDIATVQDALGMFGLLSYIDLEIPAAPHPNALLTSIRDHLNGHYEMRDLRQERADQQGLSKAFDTNLTALSLLALLVGMFLVYNTESFLIVQRRFLFMRLRAVGVTRGEIFRSVLGESACLGAVASAFGVCGGVILANSLLGLITRTVDNFYYPVHAADVVISPGLLLAVWIGGVCATVFAAIPAAMEAAATAPIQTQARVSPRPVRLLARKSVQSLSALALAGVLASFGLRNLWLDFLILSLGLVAPALLMPVYLSWMSRQLTRCLVWRELWPERIGVETVHHHRARTGVAASALCLAAAVSLGMLLMTASFRAAVDDWLRELLVADAYLSAPKSVPVPIAEQFLARLKAKLQVHDALSAVSSVTRREVMGELSVIQVAAYDLPTKARAGFRFLAGDSTAIWHHWTTSDSVIVSEPYAFHHHVGVGDTVSMRTPRGQVTFEIAGVYRDFASERGTVAMSLERFHQYWPDQGVSGIGVYLAPHARFDEFKASLAHIAAPDEPLLVRRAQDIQALSLRIFDRTFAITKVLGAIAMGVSLVGIMGALLAQQLERARDYGVLRAIGVAKYQLFRIVLAQTLLIGFVAATGAVPIGIGCALFLVQVVNLHAFGWTMPVTLPASLIFWTWAGVLAASALAAIYPAVQVVRTPPARALHYE